MKQNAVEMELRNYFAGMRNVNLLFLNSDDKDSGIGNIGKIKYRLYYEELRKITKEFNRRQIEFVAMKGIVLAQKLYAKPWIRSFGDMDILVCPARLSDATDALLAMGYVTEKRTDKDSLDEYLCEINREHHLPPFVKEESMPIPFVIELHVDIVPLWMFQIEKNLTEKILSRRVTVWEIPQMEKYDELIFQMLHMVKHYIFEMTLGFISGNVQASLNLRDLHEIALLLDKWEGKFENCEFANRVKEYTVENEILFVVRWLREIYPVTSRKLMSVELEAREKGCFVNRFCNLNISRNIQNILYCNPQVLASDAIDIMQESALTLPCAGSKGIEIWPGNEVDWVQIDNECPVKDNRFGTYLVSGKYREGTVYHVRFCALWDESYLYHYIEINDPNACFYYHMGDAEVQEIRGCDYVRLHFNTGRRGEGEPFVKAFNLKPYYNANGEMDVFVEEEFHCKKGGVHALEKNICRTFFKKREGQYLMAVGIPWELLGCRPEPELEIYFDIWLRTNDFTMEWQSAYHAWYDVSAYAKLKLL